MNSSLLRKSLIVVDPSVQHYQTLISNLSPNTQVLILNSQQDGVEQITAWLDQHTDIASLHILSHGAAATLYLGNAALSQTTLSRYKTHLQSWAEHLAQTAEILLYGCEVAAGAIGKAFVQRLSQWTDRSIAASTTKVGQAQLGGNWQLDFATTSLQTAIAFSPEAMAAYPAVLEQTLLQETFTGADVADNTAWRSGIGAGTTSAFPFLTARATPTASGIGGLQGSPTGVALDQPGNGVLRLTNNANNQATFVLFDRPVQATAGLRVTFDLFAYGGTGADGISFFLIDGTQTPTQAGSFGGSLGYAQRDGASGLQGGYLGVGFDELGNYSSATEGRIGGAPVGVPGGGVVLPGAVPDAIAIRGSQANDYRYLTGADLKVTDPNFSIDVPASAANPTPTREQARRRVQVELTQTGLLNVSIDRNQDNDFDDPGENAITNYDVAAVNGAVPDAFKFGFAGGTGDATNIHEIRNLSITQLTNPPETSNFLVDVRAGQTLILSGFAATDPDPNGAIASYTITTLPAPADGVLFLGNPANNGTRITAGQVLTPAQINQVFFQATPGFDGGSFTYSATDNAGAIDATPAVVRLNLVGTLPSPGPQPEPGPDPDPDEAGCLPGRSLTIRGNNGVLKGTANSDRIYGRGGRDTLLGRACRDKLDGRGGNDKLFGGGASDFLFGRTGADSLHGEGGNDLMDAGGGRDRLYGGRGRDLLKGRPGNDLLRGEAGNDTLSGGAGGDRLYGAIGNDNLFGREDNDRLFGGRGNDRMSGNEGSDRLFGGSERDDLYGRTGNDLVRGEAGDDVLRGQSGDDRLFGGPGNDRLTGGPGNDLLVGGRGADTLTGNAGRDRFLYLAFSDRGDRITDFTRGQDLINLRFLFDDARFGQADRFRYVRLAQTGADTTLQVDSNGDAAGGLIALATIVGVNANQLGASNFILA